MPHTPDPFFNLEEEILRALKQWAKDNPTTTLLQGLPRVRNLRKSGLAPPEAAKQHLREGLNGLVKDQPQLGELLEKRFVEGLSVREVALQLHLGESTILLRQRAAITALATILRRQAWQALEERQNFLATRLPARPDQSLLGIDPLLMQVHGLLATTEAPWLIALEGIGGIGKSALADALLRRLIEQGEYDNFGWISAPATVVALENQGELSDRPALSEEALVHGLIRQLVPEILGATELSAEEALGKLERYLKLYPHVIVVDNLESVADIRSLLPVLRRLSAPTKFLLTSRASYYEALLYHVTVPPLGEAHAVALIRQEAEARNLPSLAAQRAEALAAVYQTVGGNPLALRLVIGQTHIHDLQQILDDLIQARSQAAEDLYQHIYRRAWENLDEPARRLLLVMPLVSQAGEPFEFLMSLSGFDHDTAYDTVNRLVGLNLVDVGGTVASHLYTIHPLTRSFLHHQVLRW